MKRILIIKFWALGDILMATPLLTALKKQWPECRISWLADTQYADILRGNPLVDEVIAFDSGEWRREFRYGRFLSYWRISRRLQQSLYSRKFDCVLNLTAEKWWSIWFNAAPVRIGLFPRPSPGLMGRLYTTAIPRPVEGVKHNSEHYLRPAEALEIAGPHDMHLVMGVLPEDQRAAQEFLQSQPNYHPDKPIILLHPGTSQASKCWLPEHFASLAVMLQSRFNVVVTGSLKEQVLADAIAHAMPEASEAPIIAAGQLKTLQQTAAMVQNAASVVTGDTSILHIASALGTPLIGIYGSTRPGDNAPLFGPQTLLFDDAVPCAPCYKSHCPLAGKDYLRCQRAVTPKQVFEAIQALLK